ncbi:synaptic vesicular amine transporter-like [Trichogramma pretiosum]|uniref:synaptic vesicular amine transporter-like n=1 Tax=Trichogramma pretiosum TaxID=7493 RepID=UPI000C71B143|nr:synaptic vesicular amine transporter-like [Trichogramma pretiosum]
MWAKCPAGQFSLVSTVYFSLLLDNILLTVVVPIVPDYLYVTNGSSSSSSDLVVDENGRVGLLLSSKALVQLVLNPAVGSLTGRLGYARPLLLGNVGLLLVALLFAFGRTYAVLFLARSVQGLSSACIGVSGMSLVASRYPEEDQRSRVMGYVLGSVALGVLLGYPMGSVLYDLGGKRAPFLLVAALVAALIVVQIYAVEFDAVEQKAESDANWMRLLLDPRILIIAGAIWISTTPMAILEPCLPIWLRSHIKPKKWQLGTVFIPDSLGYLLGTNFFGLWAFRHGRCRTAVLAMAVVGLSALGIPRARSMAELAVPHLGLGLGIGVADAALVPLLAALVDRRPTASYGPVYSLQQAAVCLAYSLGPIASGELVKSIGFEWVMRLAGLACLAYCPLLVYLARERRRTADEITIIPMTDRRGINDAANNRQTYSSVEKAPASSQARYQRFRDDSTDDDAGL